MAALHTILVASTGPLVRLACDDASAGRHRAFGGVVRVGLQPRSDRDPSVRRVPSVSRRTERPTRG